MRLDRCHHGRAKLRIAREWNHASPALLLAPEVSEVSEVSETFETSEASTLAPPCPQE